MSRDKVERFPIPDEPLERFMGMLYAMVEPFGVDKVPEVMHYVELLGQAVDRHVFESSHVAGSGKRTTADRRRFIAIFKARYLHATDLEYTRPMTPADAKLIGQVNELLEQKGFDAEEFLQWVFEVFLEENPKFNPPTLKFVCSHFVTEKFVYEHREQMVQKKKEEAAKTEALAVIGRARAVMRVARDEGRIGDAEKVVEALKKYREGCIMIGEVRISVEEAEKQTGHIKAVEGGEHGDAE